MKNPKKKRSIRYEQIPSDVANNSTMTPQAAYGKKREEIEPQNQKSKCIYDLRRKG